MTHFTNRVAGGVAGGVGVGAGIALANALFGSAGQPPTTGYREQAVWSAEINGTILMMMAQIAPNGTTTWLQLYGVENGAYMLLGGRSSMLHMMALVQQWEHYLTAGHTVEDWRAALAPQQQRQLPAISEESGQ